MIKKITSIGVMAMLCLSFLASAQQQSSAFKAFGGLKPGDQLPAVTIAKVYDLASNRYAPMSLNAMAGKAIILDFFATWCGTCISRFPHVQAIQHANASKLMILLVNTSGRDNDEKVAKFMQGYYRQHPDFNLSYALRDSTLELLLPTKMLPHYVWIGADGIIKAITGWEDVTDDNVKKLVNGMPILVKIKEW